ncbi:hypothetical protein [Methylobacterium sp. SI9]|uniref:hypothetical protein n=1 Tax=Methylobacterium guangdongense TaxID=3138811 RepID=UPI00313C8529
MLKEERERARTALDRIHVAERAPAEIEPEIVAKFGQLMRANVTTGEVPFRKAWLQAVVDRIEVDANVIRIVSKVNLEVAVIGAASLATLGVRSSIRKWRARKDSNL